MVGGRGVRLADESGVTEPELFVCVDLAEQGQAESLVPRPRWKRNGSIPEKLQTTMNVEFDPHADASSPCDGRVTRTWCSTKL